MMKKKWMNKKDFNGAKYEWFMIINSNWFLLLSVECIKCEKYQPQPRFQTTELNGIPITLLDTIMMG